MQKDKKNLYLSVAVLSILVLTVPSFLIETTNAHTPPMTIATYAYVSVAPNPIGVDQTARVLMWIDQTISGGTIDNNVRFHNFKLTITKPDNTTETKTWDTVWDLTSSQGYTYTPNQIGTYTFKFEFPGMEYNAYEHSASSAYVNDTYAASSASTTLTVQETQIPTIGSPPLPTEYWTRPIYGKNTAWWSISSDWFGTGSPAFPPVSTGSERYSHDTIGPLTSHIMWTKPLQSGGVVGGDNFAIQGDTYSDGTSRATKYSNPIIMGGKIIYKEPVFMGGSSGPTTCVDLRTGKLIWSRDDVPAISFGYNYAVHTADTQGVFAVLYTSNFARAFDVDTGNALYNVTGVPSGTAVIGPNGEILRYTMTNAGTSSNPQWYLAEWNSSKLWTYTLGSGIGYSSVLDGGVADPKNASYRYDWNVSIPWITSASNPNTVECAFFNDVMILRNGSLPTSGLNTLDHLCFKS